MSLEAKRTLMFAVLKFLRSEINQETATPDVKESLEVATQCLESCYEVSIDDEICKNNFDSGMDLLAIAEKNVIKRELPSDLKEKANNLKNEGNELMKQEKYKEALDSYNKAIEIDKNNAVFYCNRAAAYSKLSDFANSIEDCKNALKIDPTYSKAWGRLGLALLSNNQVEESYEAYNKAIQLEPANEGYKQNLKVVEERLKNMSTEGQDSPFGNLGNMMGMFNNPQFMNMARQMMSDPQMQSMMSNMMSGMGRPPGAPSGAPPSVPSGAEQAATGQAQGQATQAPFLGADLNTLLQAGQQFAQQLYQSNPDLVNNLRQQMNPNAPQDEQNRDAQN